MDDPIRAVIGTIHSYGRTISLDGSSGRATAVLDDDFHAFTLELAHCDGIISDIRTDIVRLPWTTCPGAVAGLQLLIGTALTDLRRRIGAIPRFAYCTHLGDMASLAAAQAQRGNARDYRLEVMLDDAGPLSLTAYRNTILLADIGFAAVTSDYSVEPLLPALPSTLDDEARFVAMRALHVSFGHLIDWKGLRNAAELRQPPSCHSFQPDVARLARPSRDRDDDATSAAGAD